MLTRRQAEIRRQEREESDEEYEDSLPPPEENGPEHLPGPVPIRQVVREEVRALLDLHPDEPDEEVQVRDRARVHRPRQASPPRRVRRLEEDYVYGAGDAPREDLSVKIRPFDPKDQDWYAFREHFLALADQAQWSQRTRTTRLLGCLQSSMTGIVTGLPRPITFEMLLERMDEIHGVFNAKEEAILKLQSLSMEPKEKITIYAERVRQLVARGYPNFTRADRAEQELRCFIQGLPSAGNFRREMRMKGFVTLAEAVEYGARLEQVLSDERPKGPQARVVGDSKEELSLQQMVQELAKWRESNERLIQTVQGLHLGQRGRAQGGPIMCYACGQGGHMRRNCPNLAGMPSNFPPAQ
jgi:hypothetical protein